MAKKHVGGRKRSAAEWAEIVAEFERGAEEVEAFAARLGVHPETLGWWRSRLRTARGRLALKRREVPRLVPVKIMAAPADAVVARTAAWEFRSVAGDVLRVEGGLPAEALRAVISAMTRSAVQR